MENSTLKHENDGLLPLQNQTITAMVQERAEKELGETKAKRKESLIELRKLIESEANLSSCTSDDFLLQFLRAKKFDTDKAFKLLKRYYGHRLDYPILHENYTPSHHSKLMEENFMNFLPLRTPEGCAVWTVKFGAWDSKAFTMEELVRFGLICHEQVLKNPVTQICGIVSILDLKGIYWSQILHISPSTLKGFVKAVQDSFPIRHKAIHIINHPSIFDFLFSIIKPLVKPKMRNRIHFHNDDCSLHKFLPPDMLPEEFGGTLGKLQNKQFYSSLLESESEFKEQNTFGYVVKKR